MELILTVGDIVFLVIMLWFSRIFANQKSDVRRPMFAKHLKAIISRFSSGYFTRHFDVVLAVFYVLLAFDTFVRIVERFTLIFTLLAAPLFASASAREDMVMSLKEMGYRNVTFDGCRVNFSRFFEAPIGKTGFYRYDRSFRLDRLRIEQATPLNKVYSTSGAYFRLRFPAASLSDRNYLELIKFEAWVHRNYPDIVWPVLDPQEQSDVTSAIEKIFRKRVGTRDLNYWIYYTRFGKSTIVESDFDLTYSDPKPLLAFKAAVVALSREARACKD